MNKVKRILLMLVLAIILLGITQVQATVTSTDPSVDSGGRVTITLQSSETVYAYKITLVDSAGLSFVSATSTAGQVNGSNVNGASTSGVTSLATYTFTAPSVSSDTKYSVKFNVSVSTDGEAYTSTTNTSTVTVRAAQVATPTLSKIEVTAGPSKTTYTEGENFDKSGMTVRATYSDGSTKNVDFTVTDGNSLSAGKTSVTISYTENGVTRTTSQSIQVNQKQETPAQEPETPAESQEEETPKLTSISIDGTKYENGASLIVESDVNEVTITAEGTGVSNYSISVNGESSGINVRLSEGSNEIIVTNNENRSEQIKVTINRKAVEPNAPNVIDESNENENEEEQENNDEEKLQLTELEIEDLELSPKFSPDVYSYTVNIYMDEKDYTNINVKATANIENADVKIDGTEGLVEGENIVNIVLTSEDGEEIVTYQIIVNKIKESSEIVDQTSTNTVNAEEKVEQEAESNSKKNILIATVSAIILIAIIVIICVKKFKENRKEPSLYNYELENDDDEDSEIDNNKTSPIYEEPKKKYRGKHNKE